MSDYRRDFEKRFRAAVQDLGGGAYFRATGPGMELELVQPIEQPQGDVIDRLIHRGWLESLANGGGYRMSDAGKMAYLRSMDELGDGAIHDPTEHQP